MSAREDSLVEYVARASGSPMLELPRNSNWVARRRGPVCGAVEHRAPLTRVFLDFLELAINNDLATKKPSSYLDLIYAAYVSYSAHHSRILENPMQALNHISLEGHGVALFGRGLARFRTRERVGQVLLSTWFCGFDRTCNTCDDKLGAYPWSSNLEWATANPPLILRDTSVQGGQRGAVQTSGK